MNEMKLEDLKNTWEDGKTKNTQRTELTMEGLTQILNLRTDNTMLKMKNGIRFSMIMNLLLMIVSGYILMSFSADMISLVVGLTSFAMLFLFVIYSAGQFRNASTLEESRGSIHDMLIRRINFFKIGYRWIIFSIGRSGAFVYILGSVIYLNAKYGHILLDTEDIIVHIIAISLALSIGLFANTREHNRYLTELETSLADLENKELSPDTSVYTERRKSRYIGLSILGLLLFILILLYIMA